MEREAEGVVTFFTSIPGSSNAQQISNPTEERLTL